MNRRIRFGKNQMTGRRWLVAAVVGLGWLCWATVSLAQSEFRATGPTEPVKLPPRTKGAVKVTFDLVPTRMEFDLPSFPCMVTENNIKYSNFWAETYEPRIGGGSFEPLFDRRNRYARMWIERQSDARIVVRVRGALCNTEEQIAHADIPSGSPYGQGDWVDEWFTIYPDGVHVRHVKIYTGLAPVSRPFGFDRDPPKTVHEFMEAAVLGAPGHVPTDDIEIGAVTLVRLVGDHTEKLLPEGNSQTISYDPYPDDFGDFRDANIMLVNLKAKYTPFTISMPYGARVQPYWPEDDLPHVFQTWGDPPDEGYSSALGHMLNYWHYRRTDNTLEQVYLSGMTSADDPVKELVSLAWSWISPPRLQMDEFEHTYTVLSYDPAQRAYIVPRTGRGPCALEFTLEEDEDMAEFGAPMRIINPAFIVKDWGQANVSLEVNSKPMQQSDNFRVGYEETATGTDLIIWLKMQTNSPVRISIAPM